MQWVRLTTQIFPHMFSLNLWGNTNIRTLLVQRGIYVYFVCVLKWSVHRKMYLLFNGFYLCFKFVDVSKLLLSGQRTFATSWPFVTIYTSQTRTLYDITATFLTVLWARNRTVLTITSWSVTTSDLNKNGYLERFTFFLIHVLEMNISIHYILHESKAWKSVCKIVSIEYSPYISTSQTLIVSSKKLMRLTYLAWKLQGVYSSVCPL